MWKLQVEFFSKNHKVLIYDLRGFGKSSIPTEEYSHYDDLRALLDHLEIQKAKIVGHSFGGQVAIDFALEYPEYVDSLVLISTGLGGFSFENKLWNELSELKDVKKIREKMLENEIFDSLRSDFEMNNLILNMVEEYSCWHFLNVDPVIKLNPSAVDILNELKCPVKVILGENDIDVQKDIAKKLEEDLNIQAIKIPNSGHMVNLERPEVINDLIS
jgi:pimeloyl-ACP methyl ester carboxylesterase